MEPINYTLKRSKRKTLGIRILPDGTVSISAPLRLPKTTIEAMVEAKRNWIETKQKELATQQGVFSTFMFQEGQLLFFLGQSYPLCFCKETLNKKGVTLEANRILLCSSDLHTTKVLLVKWYKQQASDYLLQLVASWAGRMDIQYGSIKINSAKRRWGSCNSRGNLNFPWRLMFLPPELVEYVIVHELAHCKELNHSKQFWQLVECYLPDYTERRGQLRLWEKKLLCYQEAF